LTKDEAKETEAKLRSPDEICDAAGFVVENQLPWSPLAPTKHVLTQLRRSAGSKRSRDQLDLTAAVDLISKGKFLTRIARRWRRVWGHDLLVLEDRARRLVPYSRDQDYVTESLAKIYPDSGFRVARLQEGQADFEYRVPASCLHREYEIPSPSTLVLALTDLGCLSKNITESNTIDVWIKLGRDLRDNGNQALALVPCHPDRIHRELAQLWQVIPWEYDGNLTDPCKRVSSWRNFQVGV